MLNPRRTLPAEPELDEQAVRKQLEWLHSKLYRTEAMQGLIQSPHWEGYCQEFEDERTRLQQENQILNPLAPDHLAQLLRNQGMLDMIDMILERPQQMTQQATQEGWLDKFKRLQAKLLNRKAG